MRSNRFSTWMLACLFTVQMSGAAWAVLPVPAPADSEPAVALPGKTRRPGPAEHTPAYPDAVTTDYELWPGDSLSIHMWGANNDLSHQVTVNPEGSIYVPRIGEVSVAGKTTGQIEAVLQRVVARQAAGTRILVLLTQGRPINVFVYGQVNHPGPVPFRANMRLSDAINAAGGPTGQAWLHNVKITRAGHGKAGQVVDVNANNILYKGRFDLDPKVGANDIVLVPEAFLSLNNFKELSAILLGGLGLVGLIAGVLGRSGQP